MKNRCCIITEKYFALCKIYCTITRQYFALRKAFHEIGGKHLTVHETYYTIRGHYLHNAKFIVLFEDNILHCAKHMVQDRTRLCTMQNNIVLLEGNTFLCTTQNNIVLLQDNTLHYAKHFVQMENPLHCNGLTLGKLSSCTSRKGVLDVDLVRAAQVHKWLDNDTGSKIEDQPKHDGYG